MLSSNVLLLMCGLAGAASGDQGEPIRVCADPDNLPYSSRELQGLENKIAAAIAQDLGASLSYYWWPYQRGRVRNTLQVDQCDVLIGLLRQPASVVSPLGRSSQR